MSLKLQDAYLKQCGSSINNEYESTNFLLKYLYANFKHPRSRTPKMYLHSVQTGGCSLENLLVLFETCKNSLLKSVKGQGQKKCNFRKHRPLIYIHSCLKKPTSSV